MTETKYGKYFVKYDPKWTEAVRQSVGQLWPGHEDLPTPPILLLTDSSVIKGCNYYFLHWIIPGSEKWADPKRAPFIAGHPPHIHQEAELLFHIGTDMDHPEDLGGEVELYMGPEMEKHVITTTCVVYIPPKMIHCPWIIKKVSRPWLFMEVNQGPKRTQKVYPQVLPMEMRKRMDWTGWLFDQPGFEDAPTRMVKRKRGK